MNTHVVPAFHVVDTVMAVVVAGVAVLLVSLVREPARQKLMAIVVAGAGAAYLHGGLGPLEFAYTTVATAVAYFGLRSYRFIAVAWLMHTGWDVVHHLFAEPIVYFAPTSSAQCAITDALLAGWFWFGAPSFLKASAQLPSTSST